MPTKDEVEPKPESAKIQIGISGWWAICAKAQSDVRFYFHDTVAVATVNGHRASCDYIAAPENLTKYISREEAAQRVAFITACKLAFPNAVKELNQD